MEAIPFYATAGAAWLRFALMLLAVAAATLAMMWYKDGQRGNAVIHMAIAVSAAVSATCW